LKRFVEETTLSKAQRRALERHALAALAAAGGS
jgi:hypothetical protein